MTQPTEIHTLAGAYALDALTEIERASFTRHIAACEACATEVAELRETASRLGAAAWEAPPPSLRASVLSEISRTRQIPVGSPEPFTHGEVAVRRWRRFSAAAVAAGIVAVGGVATTWVVEENRVREAQQQTQQAQTDLEQQRRITAILGAPDVQLHGVDVKGGGRITVAISPSAGQGVALMAGLPMPPPGEVYQLWMIRGERPSSAGVMAFGQRSGVNLLPDIRGADTFGVTAEPGPNGSATPAPDLVAAVPLV
jgi:anti-sigma factor RsiW